LIQEYRKWAKLKSTYIDGYLAHINAATGRIHPDLMPLATQTGRFAARNPNLQTCPRKGNDPIGVRQFIAAPEDSVILSLDFSQIELRVGAFYCRDRKMMETYRTGGDIHAQTTSVIFGIPFAQAIDKNALDYKERRTIAKNCNFGTFYGLYAAGLQRTLRFKAGLDVSKAQCEEIIANLKAGYPGLAAWQEQQKRYVANTCYAQTWLGRRRYLYGILSQDWGKRSFAERCALNTPIQGTAADILKLACGRIVGSLPLRPWIKPLLQIHDELVFEVPKDKVDDAIQFIKACMETQPFPGFDVPIVAEAAVGSNFGELKELEVLS
jgi:DNA polymerase-1